MTSRPISPRGLRATVACLALALAAPGAAHAGGFGPPVPLAGKDDASDVQVAMAPNGRTAVLYERLVRVGRQYREQWRLAMGPSPRQLGRPRTLTVGGRTHRYDADPISLVARADGSFLLCGYAKRVQSCAVAPDGKGFGGLFGVGARGRRFSVNPRPDGSFVIVYSTETVTKDDRFAGSTLSTAVMSSGGVLGPEHAVVRTRHEQEHNADSQSLAVAADGTVAIKANLPVPGTEHDTQLGIRVMAPGSDAFGPIVPVPGEPLDNNLALVGGNPSLVITYAGSADGTESGAETTRVIRRLPDGTFTPELALPSTARRLPGVGGDGIGGRLLTLPSGDLFAVSGRAATEEGDSDCFNQIAGEIAAGPLVAPGTTGAQALSAPGQISIYPQATVLADGTVIAAWQDGVNYHDDFRVEAAVRAPGATSFAPSRRLPRLAGVDGAVLASGGDEAALVWATTLPGRDTPSLVVSSYTATGPLAKQVRLPKHPETNCDE